MTSISLEARTPATRSVAAATHLETLVTGLVLFASLNAVVPLVFNPRAGAAAVTTVLRDPVSQKAWALIFLFAVVAGARFHREILAAAAANPPIVVLCLLALLSAGWSSVGSETLTHAMEFTLLTVLGLYMGVRHGITRLVAITGWVLLIALALSVIFALAFPKYGLDPFHDERWRGVFTTKNELGRICVYGGVIWAIRTLAGDTSRRLGVLLVLAFGWVGFESGSRTALAVSVMLVGVSLLAWPFPREASMAVPLKGFVLAMLALAVVLTYGSMDILLRIVGADANLTGRAGIWAAVWSAIGNHPLFGYGFDAFWRGIEGPSLAVWQATGYRTPHSHNGFLDLLLGLGVAGLLAFIAAFALVLRRSFEALRVGIGTARIFPFVYLAMLIFYNLTESSLLGTKSLEWMLFAAVAGSLPLRDSERRPIDAR